MSDTLKLPRTDIQALRGLAVLMVVLYHTKVGEPQAGFLGVDVFFVISGFLITTLVAKGIDRGTFTLSEFYFRRAKRLLPAAYVTFFITAVCAPWFLNQQELRDFATQVIGAVTFTGNIVLWQQTGYFEGAGDLKPLLHVWSLAIEEQYYFLLPAALLFTRPSRWLWGAVAAVLLSLALCTAGGVFKPVATFYLLPTRAWELLIGSVGALWLLSPQTDRRVAVERVIKLLFVPALLCLLVLPFLPVVGIHPGINAVLIALATLVIILRNSHRLNSALPTRVLAHVGDFSYSLYLVHWPIIAFMKNAWLGSDPLLPLEMRLSALALSFSLAYLLYRVIEDPIRKRSFEFSVPLIVKVTVSSVLLVVITPLVLLQTKAEQIALRDARAINPGFSTICDYKGKFVARRECRSKENPDLLVWGDSYAMHLVPGLVNEWPNGLMQATMSGCGPFLGLAPRRKVNGELDARDQAWAERCIAFNQSVVDFLKATPSIKTVVLSSPLVFYFNSKAYDHVVLDNNVFIVKPVSAANALNSIQITIVTLRSLGKKVVLVAPPPSSDFDIGACMERQLSGKVMFGRPNGCTVDRAEYQSKREVVLNFLNSVAIATDLAVIRFDPWLCKEKNCDTLIDGTMIYRDTGHLSIAGSTMLAGRMHLGRLILEQAR